MHSVRPVIKVKDGAYFNCVTNGTDVPVVFVYFIHQSISRKRFTILQKKHNLKTVWIKWPTQDRAT